MPLKFGVMGFLKYVNEVTGTDPLQVLTNMKDQYKLIHAYVYAGLKCAGNNVTIEQVDEFVQNMSFEDGTAVVRLATEAMQGGDGQPGEKESREIVAETT